jgi:hypothetical protein
MQVSGNLLGLEPTTTQASNAQGLSAKPTLEAGQIASWVDSKDREKECQQ